MRNHSATRVPVAVTVLSLLACLFVGTAGPATAATKPVINGPVFNDPIGTPAQQEAVFTQLISLINATPAGETIRSSMFELEDSAVASALIAAHERGVDVKLVVDDNTRDKGSAAYSSLLGSLGDDDTAASWIVVCDDQFEDDDGVDDVSRGCAATPPPNPAYNHNKFFIFSKIGPFDDGTSYDKVVFQSSSNLNDWYKVESYNDAITFVDARVYDGYAKFHDDQRRLRHSASGDNTYYWSTHRLDLSSVLLPAWRLELRQPLQRHDRQHAQRDLVLLYRRRRQAAPDRHPGRDVPVPGLTSAGCAEACRKARPGLLG